MNEDSPVRSRSRRERTRGVMVDVLGNSEGDAARYKFQTRYMEGMPS
jgi:hypothetical protein